MAPFTNRSASEQTKSQASELNDHSGETGTLGAAFIELLSLMRPEERAALLKKWRLEYKIRD